MGKLSLGQSVDVTLTVNVEGEVFSKKKEGVVTGILSSYNDNGAIVTKYQVRESVPCEWYSPKVIKGYSEDFEVEAI